MSKHLIKILSICAFVILLPLIVLGAALCVTEAIGITLTVKADGIEGGANTESHVAIFIDGQKQDENTITIKKNTEVTVTYEGVGYDFQGWYNGNYSEINLDEAKPVADKDHASYTFLVRGNTVLTAVRNVKTYTVNYQGKEADGETDITLQSQSCVYGEDLAVLVDETGTLQLKGWYIAGTEAEEGVVVTKVANFETSGTYTLNPYWIDQEAIEYTLHVQYHAKSEETQDVTFSLSAGFGEYRTRYGYTFKGYKCGDAIYNSASTDFAGLIAAADANNEINVVAVWECDYDISFNFGVSGFSAVFTDAAHTNPAVVDENETSINFADADDCYDLTDDVYEFFKNELNATKFYNAAGKEVVWNGEFKLTINGQYVRTTGDNPSPINYNRSSKTLPFSVLMGYFEGVVDGGIDTFEGQRLGVVLTFVEVA